MRKKLIIITVFVLLLISVSLYYTYAIDVKIEEVSSSNADLTFNININDTDGRTITVGADKTKVFDVFITNKNSGTINYGLAYNSTNPDGVTIAQLNTSKNKVSELIEANSTHQVSLIIINNTEEELTYNIAPITGYEKGGDLIVPEGYTLISEMYEFGVPNAPDLVQGLVPITYSNNKWVKADSSNENNSWYDYDNKKWANAVLVSSDYRYSNNNDTFRVGDEVPEDAILAYYVWIPRYKYKVWNINKEIGIDSYDAYNKGIDIEFEFKTLNTGEISCTYDFTITDGSLSEKCSGSNGDYYTHPAFWWDNDGDGIREIDEELEGIWISKFKISSSDGTEGGQTVNLLPRFKPNAPIWRGNDISGFSLVIQNMQKSSNEYGLTTDKTITDSHMIKNIEWGSIAYLTHSDYGLCNNNECEDMFSNTYEEYMTGCGPQSATSTNSGKICNAYDTEIGQLASTTGNIYGIYDMSGGEYEYVMANSSETSGEYTYNVCDAGNYYSYSATTAKYIDTYAYGSSDLNQTAYNRARLGDATGEIVLKIGDYYNSYRGGWYDVSSFMLTNYKPWFSRSSSYYSSKNEFFSFHAKMGGYEGNSTRATLISLN